MRRRSFSPLTRLALLGCVIAVAIPSLAQAATGSAARSGAFRFAAPIFVGRALAGGEPSVAYAVKSGLLIYTSHEGTTHLFTSGVAGAPAESGAFITGYHNQVNIWWSADNGLKWHLVPFGSHTDPFATGFSDPDLTQDANGNIYNTGIDLANDALFSSQNGGRTWLTGTFNCHEGDRPWLAGGQDNEVFLSTDTEEAGHQIYHSINAGASCQSKGVSDGGTVPKGRPLAGWSYEGQGKIFYDHRRGSLLEPVLYTNPKTNLFGGVGIGILPRASKAFGSAGGKFKDVLIARSTEYAHWPSMGIDSRGNYYMVWDTDARDHHSRNGCPATDSGSESSGSLPPVNAYSPLANRVLMSVSTDGGLRWSRPRTVAYAPGHRLLWPWVVAGKAGHIGIVWYQYNKVVDPDCAPTSASVSVMAAEISGATGAHPHETIVNAAGRPIHFGSICAGGTTCAADNVITGEDRRLGDYFTLNTDKRGCIMVATGDTTLLDPITHGQSPISHPLFLHQDSGPSLTGGQCGKVSSHHSSSAHHRHHPSRPSRRPRRRHHSRGFTG